jgi:LDH2 family malate/lactate/ureidoglycolate dehydrogenase
MVEDPSDNGTSATVRVDPEEAPDFVQRVLVIHGVPVDNATIISRCLIAADLRGVDTHGMHRIPSYVERIRQGVLDPSASPSVQQVTPAAAHVDRIS